MTQSPSSTPTFMPAGASTERELIDRRIVLAYFSASLAHITVAMLAGWLFSFQFLQVYPFSGLEVMSPARWRMVHTNSILYGFIANAFLGLLHWAVPRLTLRPVLSVKLSWFICGAWQLLVAGTVLGLLAGHAQGVQWRETPIYIDPVAQIVLIFMAINFLHPILATQTSMYVSLWYFIAAFVWTAIAYAMGSFLPQYFAGGAPSGAVIGLFTHDLAGLSVTLFGWGLMYYFVPVILKKPIWSHGLALVGFWGLVSFYPLFGIHHFLSKPIFMTLQHEALTATIAAEVIAGTVIVNFFVTMRHCGKRLRSNLPIRWFYLGMVFYVVACLQSACQAAMQFQRITHFTDWGVGHSHLVMLGVFGFWILGAMTHLVPRLLGASGWWHPNLNSWHFWLTGTGMLVMFLDLSAAGLVQGLMWRELTPWEASVTASRPFWLVRTIAGLMILGGHLPFLWNVAMTAVCRGPALAGQAEGCGGAAAARIGPNRVGRLHERRAEVLLTAGLGLFASAFIVVAAMPWITCRDQPERTVEELAEDGILHDFVELAERYPERFHASFPDGVTTASFAQALALGRKIYVAEGCWHCHSQQVRSVSSDALRWGPPSKAWEYRNELQRPVLFGTRRVGPDLSREGGRRSNDWHLAHFYKPTSVVPASVMPRYPWFFDTDGYPNQRGMAVITYLQWLGSWLDAYPNYEVELPLNSGDGDKRTGVGRRRGAASRGEEPEDG